MPIGLCPILYQRLEGKPREGFQELWNWDLMNSCNPLANGDLNDDLEDIICYGEDTGHSPFEYQTIVLRPPMPRFQMLLLNLQLIYQILLTPYKNPNVLL